MLCPTDSPFSIAPAQIYTDKNKTKMQWIILSSLLYIICHFMFLLRPVMSLEQYQCNLNMFCIGASSLHLASLPWLFKLTFSTVCLAPNLDLSRFQPLFLLCPPLDRLFFFFPPGTLTTQLILWISSLIAEGSATKSHVSLHIKIGIIPSCFSGKRSLPCNEMILQSCFC